MSDNVNLVYTRGLYELFRNAHDPDAAGTVVRWLLERSTSTYTPNRDHDFVADLSGLVEISVASYARQTWGGKAVSLDDTNDRVAWDGNDLAFGNLESGQSVKSLIGYIQVGGDDTTPADDILVCRFNGKINVVLAADAANAATTLWVEPLTAALLSGTALDFGGGGTCTLSANAALGARSLAVSALGASRTAGLSSEALHDPGTGPSLPAPLQGGAFNVTISDLLRISQRG